MKKLMFALLIVCCFLSATGAALATGSHVHQKDRVTLTEPQGCQAFQRQLATTRHGVGAIKADLHDPLDQGNIATLSAALSRYSTQASQAQAKLSACLSMGTDPAQPQACQVYQDQLTELHDAIQALKADLRDPALDQNSKAADAAILARLQMQMSQVQTKLTTCLNPGA